jgi:hypothetical protein
MRVNDPYCCCLRWTTEEPTDVEILDGHRRYLRCSGMGCGRFTRARCPGRIFRRHSPRAPMLAKAPDVPAPGINDVVRERRAVSADMAMRPARHFAGDARSGLVCIRPTIFGGGGADQQELFGPRASAPQQLVWATVSELGRLHNDFVNDQTRLHRRVPRHDRQPRPHPHERLGQVPGDRPVLVGRSQAPAGMALAIHSLVGGAVRLGGAGRRTNAGGRRRPD